jgi:hypothetical protein
MDFATLKAELINRADDESISEANLIRWINMAYESVQSRYMWPWMISSTTDSTVADQALYDLPSDYNKMLDLLVDGNRYGFIPYYRRNDVTWSNKYTIIDGQYKLYATPSTSGSDNIALSYYMNKQSLVNAADEPAFDSNFHEVLIYQGLVYYSEKERDLAEGSFFKTEVENILSAMRDFYFKDSDEEVVRMRDIRERWTTMDTETNSDLDG